jgi:hypothetical protein
MASNDYYGQPGQNYNQGGGGGYNQGPPQQPYGQAPSAWDQYGGGQQTHSPYPPQDQGYGAPPPQQHQNYDQGYNPNQGYNQSPAPYGQQPQYDQQRDSHSPYPPAQQQAPYGAPPAGHQPAYGDSNAPPGAAGPDGVEGERGLGKTLLGGTAGALLGHQAGHGMLGAIGGAVVANMLGGDKDKEK